MYYLRSRPAANAIQFTVDQRVVMEAKQQQQQSNKAAKKSSEYQEAAMACSIENKEACVMCSA